MVLGVLQSHNSTSMHYVCPYNDTRILSKTQLIMINQSNAGHFNPKDFVNCVQDGVDKDLRVEMSCICLIYHYQLCLAQESCIIVLSTQL